MLKGYKYRLHPTPAQAKFLIKTTRLRPVHLQQALRRDGRLLGLQVETAVARLLHDEQPTWHDPHRGRQGSAAEGRVRAVHPTSSV